MEENQAVHIGHRERMIEKVYKNPSALLDHEILEVLLYSFIPRIDTNSIAHNLIRTFGSIYGVFSASPIELASVKGVGKKTASQIALLGVLLNDISLRNYHPKKTLLFSLEAITKEIKEYFRAIKVEKVIMVLLDKAYKHIITIDFFDSDDSNALVNISEVAKAFALHKPTYCVIAHNHPSGISAFSDKDDYTTKKVNLLCEIHNVNFLDHVIFGKEDVFSYHNTGRMDIIKRSANLDQIIKEVK